MYKVRNGLAPEYIAELFTIANKGYTLRNADYDVPRYTTVRFGKRSLRYFGPYLWSKLEASDRRRETVDNFRNSIRKKDLASLIEDSCVNCNICNK